MYSPSTMAGQLTPKSSLHSLLAAGTNFAIVDSHGIPKTKNLTPTQIAKVMRILDEPDVPQQTGMQRYYASGSMSSIGTYSSTGSAEASTESDDR